MLTWLTLVISLLVPVAGAVDKDGARPGSLPYCIEIDPTWAREPVWTQAQVKSALERWLAFFDRNRMDARPRFAHQVEKCAPEEGALRFLIGVAKPAGPRLKIPLARASGANVFIDPLTTSAHFPHRLLHEIGHAFGMGADAVPVMIADFDRLLESPEWGPYLGRIEMPTWRYQLREGDVIVYSDGSAPNRLLPLPLGLPAHGRHALRLAVEDMRDANVTLALEVKDEAGQARLHWRGEFQLRSSASCALILNASASLDRDVPREAEGVFEDERGHHYPAILEAAPGSLLRVYIPQNKRWWSVENYFSVRPWRSPRTSPIARPPVD